MSPLPISPVPKSAKAGLFKRLRQRLWPTRPAPDANDQPPDRPTAAPSLPPSWSPPGGALAPVKPPALKPTVKEPPKRRADPKPKPLPRPTLVSPLPATDQRQTIALALQGGGAHGAFSWGVVDRLLDEPDLHIECLSGTSAGAMNATLCAYGLLSGGRKGAQDLMATFWQQVARVGALTPFRRSWFDRLEGTWSLDHSPWLALMDVARQFVSPYQTNPLGLNPLQELLESLVDFPALRAQSQIGVYIAATNVHSGKASIFSTPELDAPRVMASACLPFLFQAVEIDGVPYWDGGYLSNPPLLPLVSHGTSRDLVIVPINPRHRVSTPRTARDIFNRLNEITFNSSLNQDLSTLRLINQLIDSGQLKEGEHRRLYLHFLDDDDAMRQLTATSKINTEWEFLSYLHTLGHQAATHWLTANRPCLGHRDSPVPSGVRGEGVLVG